MFQGSLKIFAILAIIMAFTWFAEAQLYGTEASQSGQAQLETPEPFEVWINAKWNIFQTAMDGDYTGETKTIIMNRMLFSYPTEVGWKLWWTFMNYWACGCVDTQLYDYYTGYHHINGFDLFNCFERSENAICNTFAVDVLNVFDNYLKGFGLTIDEGDFTKFKAHQKGLLEQVGDFLWALPDAFGKFIQLATFSIPQMPIYMTAILNLIFIPLYVVMAICIAPIVAKFIEAIGNLIPFT